VPRLHRQTRPGFALHVADAKPGQTLVLTFHRVRRKPGGRSRGKKVRVVVEHPEDVVISIDEGKRIADTA
jgi:hypothetical protein